MVKLCSLRAHVATVIAKHGGLRLAARACHVNEGYLCRLASGKKCNPGKQMMKKLGIKKLVIYVWAYDERQPQIR